MRRAEVGDPPGCSSPPSQGVRAPHLRRLRLRSTTPGGPPSPRVPASGAVVECQRADRTVALRSGPEVQIQWDHGDTGDESDDSTDASGHSEPGPEFMATPTLVLIVPRPEDDERKAGADPDDSDHQRPHVGDYPAMTPASALFGRGGGRGRGRGGRRRAEPSHVEAESVVVGEGGDEQPDAAPTSARLGEREPGLNYVPVIRVSEATSTHLSTGFSSWGIAGGRHSDKESSGTTSDPGFPTGFPLEVGSRQG